MHGRVVKVRAGHTQAFHRHFVPSPPEGMHYWCEACELEGKKTDASTFCIQTYTMLCTNHKKDCYSTWRRLPKYVMNK